MVFTVLVVLFGQYYSSVLNSICIDKNEISKASCSSCRRTYVICYILSECLYKRSNSKRYSETVREALALATELNISSANK